MKSRNLASRRNVLRLLNAVMLFAAAWLAYRAVRIPEAFGASLKSPSLGVDVDFYTGPVARKAWLTMKKAGVQFVVAQAWGGRSRNEFAISQLSGARTIAGMKEAAYILLNYDDKVCPTYDRPRRDGNGKCIGDLIAQGQPGARWQVRQGAAALGSELSRVVFIAIDVEWFLKAAPAMDPASQAMRRSYIVDAIDEVRRLHKKPVIYTRNSSNHWRDITGCDNASSGNDCLGLRRALNKPEPVPLWDVQDGLPKLGDFQPYGEWALRLGRQYQLDRNLFGLNPQRTVDLNVFDSSLFNVKIAQSGRGVRKTAASRSY